MTISTMLLIFLCATPALGVLILFLLALLRVSADTRPVSEDTGEWE